MNTFEIKEAKEEMGRLSERMEEIVDTADRAGRDMTKAEQREFDECERKFKMHKSRIQNGSLSTNGDSKELLVAGGMTKQNPDTWITKEGKKLNVYSPAHKMARQTPEVTLGQMARAMLTGARNEAEKRALAEGTDSAGGFTVPSITSTDFFDRLRSKSRIVQAGARTIQLESDETTIARTSGDPTATWHAENTQETDSDLTFEGVKFQPSTLLILVRASRELIADSVNMDTVLENVFAGTVSAEVDRAALFGSGTAPEPEGLTQKAINEVAAGGADGDTLTDFTKFTAAIKEMLNDNATMPTAFIMNPRELITLADLTATDNQPLMKPEILKDIPMLETTNVPIDQTIGTSTDATTITGGNFQEFVIGMRQSMRIELLRERYADSYQFGFLVHMRVDFQPAHLESFAKITGIVP